MQFAAIIFVIHALSVIDFWKAGRDDLIAQAFDAVTFHQVGTVDEEDINLRPGRCDDASRLDWLEDFVCGVPWCDAPGTKQE